MPSNPISVKEYLETCLKSLREVLEARFTTLEIRLAELEERLVKRLDMTNGVAKVNSERLDDLELLRSELKGKMWGIGIAFTVVVGLIQVALKVFLH